MVALFGFVSETLRVIVGGLEFFIFSLESVVKEICFDCLSLYFLFKNSGLGIIKDYSD